MVPGPQPLLPLASLQPPLPLPSHLPNHTHWAEPVVASSQAHLPQDYSPQSHWAPSHTSFQVTPPGGRGCNVKCQGGEHPCRKRARLQGLEIQLVGMGSAGSHMLYQRGRATISHVLCTKNSIFFSMRSQKSRLSKSPNITMSLLLQKFFKNHVSQIKYVSVPPTACRPSLRRPPHVCSPVPAAPHPSKHSSRLPLTLDPPHWSPSVILLLAIPVASTSETPPLWPDPSPQTQS